MKRKVKNIINNLSVGQKVLTIIFLEIFSYSVVTTIALSQINSVGNVVKQTSDLYLPLFSSSESIRHQIQDTHFHRPNILHSCTLGIHDKDFFFVQHILCRQVTRDSNRHNRSETMSDETKFGLIH